MAPGERRKHRRVKAKDVAGHVRVDDEVLSLALPVENISMGGLFVRCTDPLPVGTPVVLELIRGGETLKVVGTTVTSLSDGMGIRFDPLPLEVSQRLSRLLVDLASERGTKVLVQAEDRGAFDFGFVSLEGEEDAFTVVPQQAVPSWTSPAAPQGQASATPSLRHPSPAAHSSGTPASAPSILAPPSPSQSTVTPRPQRGTLQPPRRVAAEPAHKPDENARLMVQVRGLLQDLGESQTELERRGREVLELRDELERLRRELTKKDARIAELERRLARGN